MMSSKAEFLDLLEQSSKYSNTMMCLLFTMIVVIGAGTCCFDINRIGKFAMVWNLTTMVLDSLDSVEK